MSGASKKTVRIDYVNANWIAGADPGSSFELMVVTEDGERHCLPISAPDMAALSSLLATGGVFLFDPEGQTVIVGNLVGQWFQNDWTQGDPRVATPAR